MYCTGVLPHKFGNLRPFVMAVRERERDRALGRLIINSVVLTEVVLNSILSLSL